MGVSHSWSNALAWALGDLSVFLVGILDFLHHCLNESIWLMEIGWWCGVHEVKVTGKLPKSFSIEGRSIVGHDDSGYAFSCKEFPQVSDGLEMMCRCHWKHVWELAEVVLPLLGVFFPKWSLKKVNTYFYPRSWRDLVGLQHLNWEVAALNACEALF